MFTDRLRELIDYKCDGKQSILAKKSGLATTVISSYFCRGSQPSLNQLIALSQALECSIGYLAGVEDDFGNITIKTENPAENTFDGLSAREQKLIEQFRFLKEGYKVLAEKQLKMIVDYQKEEPVTSSSNAFTTVKNTKK